MQDSAYEDLAEFEASYWWHVARRDLLQDLLARNLPSSREREILDVGCGTGGNLSLLSDFGRVRGVEPPGPGLDHCRAKGLGADRVLTGAADALPVEDGTVDLITLLDVLEHLDDDRAALEEARRALRPGGWLLLTVPAYRFLWSVHDEALGHRRRYMASEVHRLLNRCGFQIVRRTYALTLPLPGITAFRVAQGLFPGLYHGGSSYVRLPRPLSNLLVKALRLERAVLRVVDLPLGTSIVALAKIPELGSRP